MAAGPVDVVVSLVVAASSFTAMNPMTPPDTPVRSAPLRIAPLPTSQCPAAWETDAQRLADALAGVTGDEPGARLRQRLEAAGFVAGSDPVAPRVPARRNPADPCAAPAAPARGGS